MIIKDESIFKQGTTSSFGDSYESLTYCMINIQNQQFGLLISKGNTTKDFKTGQ